MKASGVEVRADKFPRPLSAEHTLACAVGAGSLPSDAATTADIPLGFKRRILLVGEALQRFTALVSVDVNAWALGESATAPLTAQVPPIALVCVCVPCRAALSRVHPQVVQAEVAEEQKKGKKAASAAPSKLEGTAVFSLRPLLCPGATELTGSPCCSARQTLTADALRQVPHRCTRVDRSGRVCWA